MESPSLPSVYVTAPASPTAYGVVHGSQFYSAPASPTRSWVAANACAGQGESGSCSNSDNFEFETSRKFGGDAAEGDRGERHGGRRERGGSLPAMAFADELFDNGQVMPLKPPPRFRIDGDMKSCNERLADWSPKSPGPIFRVPFARRSVWNDDFDPFMAALKKVKEENRGRKSTWHGGDDDHRDHRRTRSQSPFRGINGDESDERHGFNKENIGPMSPLQYLGGEPKLKGSIYARWVLYQTQNMDPSPKKGPNKPNSNTGKNGVYEDSKMQKIKGMIVRYTRFGKENGNGEGKEVKNPISSMLWKKFSFKYKGKNNNKSRSQNYNENESEIVSGESRIVVVKLQPAMCLGYGVAGS